MSNLRLINETTVSSTVSSSSITDVFTSDFDIYKVVAKDIVTSAEAFLRLQFINSSGSIISTGSYDWADLFMKANTTYVDRNDTNDNYIYDFNLSKGTISGGAGNTVAYIFNPTNASSYTFVLFEAVSVYDSTYAFSQKGIGVLKQTSSITGMNFIMDSSATFTGKFQIFGLRVDS